jgi:hypothetical protein
MRSGIVHDPLGPPHMWPQSLKSVRIMLTSRQPMFVWWGDELINLYNVPTRLSSAANTRKRWGSRQRPCGGRSGIR